MGHASSYCCSEGSNAQCRVRSLFERRMRTHSLHNSLQVAQSYDNPSMSLFAVVSESGTVSNSPGNCCVFGVEEKLENVDSTDSLKKVSRTKCMLCDRMPELKNKYTNSVDSKIHTTCTSCSLC